METNQATKGPSRPPRPDVNGRQPLMKSGRKRLSIAGGGPEAESAAVPDGGERANKGHFGSSPVTVKTF
jgi:hypothetical protein